MIQLKIRGMTCEHCERAVGRALAGVEGVDRVVEVDRRRERAVIEGDAAPEALVAAVREEGYEAEPAR